jgi:hypothetical protein
VWREAKRRGGIRRANPNRWPTGEHGDEWMDGGMNVEQGLEANYELSHDGGVIKWLIDAAAAMDMAAVKKMATLKSVLIIISTCLWLRDE